MIDSWVKAGLKIEFKIRLQAALELTIHSEVLQTCILRKTGL